MYAACITSSPTYIHADTFLDRSRFCICAIIKIVARGGTLFAEAFYVTTAEASVEQVVSDNLAAPLLLGLWAHTNF